MNIFNDKPTIKKEIITVLEAMKKLSPDSEEYTKVVKNLETLCSAQEKGSKNKVGILTGGLTILGSLAGILLVVYGEETRIITSKALGFIVKGRV